jgi:hypothetical protein
MAGLARIPLCRKENARQSVTSSSAAFRALGHNQMANLAGFV